MYILRLYKRRIYVLFTSFSFLTIYSINLLSLDIIYL
nr:MAG TPA: hypothetical protein [Caudoviricetes sp.]